MERVGIEEAKKIYGDNFIGVDELMPLIYRMGLVFEKVDIPEIPYSSQVLRKCSQDYILILGLPTMGGKRITIKLFRDIFGINPEISEPCLYNQDWYLSEEFINKTLDLRWYLLKKDVIEESRAVQPKELQEKSITFPPAILCIYTFFAYYFAKSELLWYHDFVWCMDTDHNGDRIYVGKYHDVDGVNKNGFSIHRHLALRDCYASLHLY